VAVEDEDALLDERTSVPASVRMRSRLATLCTSIPIFSMTGTAGRPRDLVAIATL